MDARNLAIVFGPTLIKSKDDDMTSIIRDMSDQCRIIESVILHVCQKLHIYTVKGLGIQYYLSKHIKKQFYHVIAFKGIQFVGIIYIICIM